MRRRVSAVAVLMRASVSELHGRAEVFEAECSASAAHTAKHRRRVTSGWKTAHPGDDKLRGDWWEIFEDSQLSVLEAQVAQANQTLKDCRGQFSRSAVGDQVQPIVPLSDGFGRAKSSRATGFPPIFRPEITG